MNPPPTMTRSACSWPRSRGSGAGRSEVSSQNGVVEEMEAILHSVLTQMQELL